MAPGDVYPLQPPLAMGDLWGLHGLNRPDLKDAPFVPVTPPQFRDLKTPDEIFAAIRRGDILLRHPYDSFKPVLDFIDAAAVDPDVLAINRPSIGWGATRRWCGRYSKPSTTANRWPCWWS